MVDALQRREGLGVRVLVVEDEAMVAMLIEDMLLDCGCSVVIAGRLDVGLEQLEKETFDFAILDLNLGGQWTYPIADVLMKRQIPFVFATGYGASLLEGAYAKVPTLQKPFQQADVIRVMQSLAQNRNEDPSIP